MRSENRKNDEKRSVSIVKDFMPNSYSSCLISCGSTRVLVTANVSDTIPPFLTGQNRGWLTAEYAMLPGSTVSRKQRERNKYDSRSIEIQRLIGRSLRSVLDFQAFPGILVTIDCDVIQADGGTRTASITAGFVAMALLFKRLLKEGKIKKYPVKQQLAAISCGIVEGEALLDLDYSEDSNAVADMNYVGTDAGTISEIQISGEKRSVTDEEFGELLSLARKGVGELLMIQKEILEGEE